MVCVREGTEGLYIGEETQLTDDVLLQSANYTYSIQEDCSYAFEEAKRRATLCQSIRQHSETNLRLFLRRGRKGRAELSGYRDMALSY